LKIYLACGLTHVPRELFESYASYLHRLAASLRDFSDVSVVRYALIDSDPQLSTKPAAERAKLCYDWDRRMVEEADLVVADASFPSTGLGIELQIAQNAGIPIIMLVGDHGVNRARPVDYENPDHSVHQLQVGDGIVSLMALGLPNIRKVVFYSAFDAGIAGALEAVGLYLQH